jgi:glucose-6-phosphate isomerase
VTPSSTGSDRFAHYLHWRTVLEDPFVELDLSCAGLADADLRALLGPLSKAMVAMHELERGSLANADEQRMVGHYWLRAPGLAPKPELEEAIVRAIGDIELFATATHSGRIAPPGGGSFRKVVLCGIGGSALGPMLLGDVFGGPAAPTQLHVLDNTDPDGIDRELRRLGSLRDALFLVASKSGGTPETRNGMLELEHACRAQGLDFAPRAVAITMPGSQLHERALREHWLASMPIWDWVGGRTSITSAVGLLPGALLGMDVRDFLAGAAAMDEAGRHVDPRHNPAAMLAVFWHVQGKGCGERAMVVLPYRDRLLLLSRYLQQLVMESLGKAQDRKGKTVHQGLAVYGNKGSTDQHAYVQQLRDGRHDFFATFVRVLKDRDGASIEVELGATSGDYLDGFWQGTRAALFEQGRASATLAVDTLNERTLGAMIALFERAVGIYGELVDVNAYHQPGVEAGKQAAARVLDLQRKVLAALGRELQTCRAIAAAVDADAADCWPILCHLAANREDVVGTAVHEPERAAFGRR